MRRPSVHLPAGLGLLLVLGLPACRDRLPSSPPADAASDSAADASQAQRAPAFAESKMAAQGGDPPLEAMAAARKLIRTGQLALEVADYASAAAKATQLAESHGGYLAESQS